ncbi:MAG: 50S ribosomal protein L35 [Alphaproteobacteria bacterium ADurb.Bin438]|nr:MAG: 50S ribosomal protein L35 [Alphaproteobacteria bacterium ADurb.Bin438]
MPKMKSKGSVTKRFMRTGNGDIKRPHAFKRKKLGGKSSKMKRQARGMLLVHDTNFKAINSFMYN